MSRGGRLTGSTAARQHDPAGPAPADRADNAPTLSVVVPFHNEEETVEAVCREVADVLADRREADWELIAVDDGSSDGTPRILLHLAADIPQLRAVRLVPNSGQSAALQAGFGASRGTIIATMDGDGQNDPRDIAGLMKRLERSKLDMMCGVRRRRADSLLRRISSRIANGVRRALLKDGITDVGCSMRVFRRECLASFTMFRNAHRFLPALFIMNGFTVGEHPVRHRPRLAGRSKYGFGINTRLWVGIFDLFGVYWLRARALRYGVRPLVRGPCAAGGGDRCES